MTNQLEVTNLITPIIEAFKKINAELNHLLEIGLSEYLTSQTEKYYYTNTFFHRLHKVKFSEAYYPLKASYNFFQTNFCDLEDLFNDYRSITLIGAAGSGKSTILKHIFLQTIREGKRIPIIIELRNLNDFKGNFPDFIQKKILETSASPSNDILRRTLKSGNFRFLFDGYDEIFSEKRDEIKWQIEMFADAYSKNHFLISTRPGSGFESFPRFFNFKVEELVYDDVISFVNKVISNKEKKEQILNRIFSADADPFRHFLQNPLLLSMYLMTSEQFPEIPNRKSSFYRNVFDTLYSIHDGITKNGYFREKLSNLQRDEFELLLSVFSYKTLIDGRYSFRYEDLTDILVSLQPYLKFKVSSETVIYDLVTSINVFILDGSEYSFLHRSMQEYFAALFVSKLASEKKITAYLNLIQRLRLAGTDSGRNLWHVCFELDKNDFIASFLLPELRKSQSALSKHEGKDLCKFFIMSMYPFTASLITVGEPAVSRYKLHTGSASPVHLFDFCGVKFDSKIFDLAIEDSPTFVKAMEEGASHYLDLRTADLIFKDHAGELAIRLVTDFKYSLIHRIESWESELKSSQIEIDRLLKILL